jgi:hypothetical protein
MFGFKVVNWYDAICGFDEVSACKSVLQRARRERRGTGQRQHKKRGVDETSGIPLACVRRTQQPYVSEQTKLELELDLVRHLAPPRKQALAVLVVQAKANISLAATAATAEQDRLVHADRQVEVDRRRWWFRRAVDGRTILVRGRDRRRGDV